MDRAELEALDRDTLIRRAGEAGVARPSILTRPELVDELLLRGAPRGGDPTLRRVRGFFGIARDLLASVIDRGLHLPDAADRIRSLRGPVEEIAPRKPPAVLPTVTLAEIYAAQGHRARAVDTLERVIEREPDHTAARALLAQLKDESYAVPEPPLPPEAEEEIVHTLPELDDLEVDPQEALEEAATIFAAPPVAAAHVATLPASGADLCVALAVDSTTLLVTWELGDATLKRVKRVSDGSLVLSVLVVVPTWDGPRTSRREVAVSAATQSHTVRDLPAGAVTRAAIGVTGSGGFVPLAHSAALEVPRSSRGPAHATDVLRWTPAGTVPVCALDADAEAIRRALEHPAIAAP